MTKSARQKRRTPIQGAFYLKHRADCPVVAQADGLTLRYLLPESTTTMGLQEVELSPGTETDGRTAATEQIVWQILQGAGLMKLGETQFAVVPGDIILIPPAQPYRLTNKSEVALRLNQITTPIPNPS
jgi:mannose-6-phosphate isomerase-like protein (cupin superfamily)